MARSLTVYLNIAERQEGARNYPRWVPFAHSVTNVPSKAKGVIFSVKVNLIIPDHKDAPVVFDTLPLEVPEYAVKEPLTVTLSVGDEST